MKTLLSLASLIASLGAAHATDTSVTANATNRFTVSGMVCEGCAKGIVAELKLAPGVATAEVSLTNKLAIVTYDTNQTSTVKLTKVISEAGFEAKPMAP